MSVQLLRKRFTVEEYHRMTTAGILTEDDRNELIEGEIIEMSPIGRHHAACVDRINRLFNRRLGDRAIVRVQNPIELSDRSEPQPDISLLKPRSDFYESGHPLPQDILLLVEVADSTIEFDREVKIPLYANSGISEVWLVDINEQSIAVYRQPLPNRYGDVKTLQRGESLLIKAFSEINLTVDEVLG